MRNVVTAIATVFIFGTALFINERNRQARMSSRPAVHEQPVTKVPRKTAIRAAGRIEGQTEEIELRARITEQVEVIHVKKGQWVSKGDLLLSLASEQLVGERDLAAAQLAMEEAKRERLENGFREIEIETARMEFEAAMARLRGAEKAYARALKLSRSNAVSQQTVDERYTTTSYLRANAAAAKGRLETMQLPAREDDLLAANASIRAAKARLEIAQINLDRAEIRAPTAGKILAIETEIGELTGPDSPAPLIIMSNTRQLKAVAEIDEYDALRVALGQACEITSDASDGSLANGIVIEIEPRMHRKRLFGQWAGERSDTFTRRVWIKLQQQIELPIGLPVDVYIEAIDEE